MRHLHRDGMCLAVAATLLFAAACGDDDAVIGPGAAADSATTDDATAADADTGAGTTPDSAVDVDPEDGGTTDTGHDDTGSDDAGPDDAGPSDAGPGDAGPGDTASADAGPDDTGSDDAGQSDAGPSDAGPGDTGSADAGQDDTGPDDASPDDTGSDDAGPDDGDAGDAVDPEDAQVPGDAADAGDAGEPVCESDIDCDAQPEVGACVKAICQAGECVVVSLEDGAACEDGSSCTADDVCKDAVCQPGVLVCKCLANIDCDDANPCTTDTCDAGGKSCVFAPADGACDDGNACTSGDTCADGTCQGSAADCDDGDTCTTDACDASGACTHAVNTAACDDSNACTSDDTCAEGICQGQAAVCDDGNACTTDACDPAVGECASIAIANGSEVACDDGNGCTQGDVCFDGACGGVALDCDDLNACTVDSCVSDEGCVHDSVALDGATCDDGNGCNEETVCKAGACSGGKAKDCSDGDVCTGDTCDPVDGACGHPLNTAPCDDGDACTPADACADGACVPGAAQNCDDANVCTDDACDPQTGLCSHKAPISKQATPCDDGDVCTVTDLCGEGKCAPGAALDCDDGDVCTDDTCDAADGCGHPFNSAPCSDAQQCLLGTCADGSCVPGVESGCDDGNPCTTDTCKGNVGCDHAAVADGVICKDGTKCVTDSLCGQGKCADGTKTDCVDDDVCTNDGCDPDLGCFWKANTVPCDDGDACTEKEACKNGKCLDGQPIDLTVACNDKNPCTDDACDSLLGCTHAANAAECDDGDPCNVGEACKDSACAGGTLKDCDDNSPCSADSCDAQTGECLHLVPDVDGLISCDDGNACTVGDLCGGLDCQPGPAKDCDDKDDCTKDACDNKTGDCSSVAYADSDLHACDDGDLCSKEDVCMSGVCVAKPGSEVDCDDGNVCTDDACNPKTGQCGTADNSVPCDNGDLCTYGDTCKAGACETGASQLCDDGSTCTKDTCDAQTGKCEFGNVADGTACDDGLDCTAGDVCKTGKCVAPKVSCQLYSELFDCDAGAVGWTLDKPSGKNVIWNVDKLPALPDQDKYGCTLNFNDDVDYCDSKGGQPPCQNPTGTATSPVIDGTKAFGSTLRLRFDTFYQVDSYGDIPVIRVLNAQTGVVLHQFYMQKSSQNQNTWRHLQVQIGKALGVQFRLVLGLQTATGWQGNHGKGWFVDNIVIDMQPVAEVCGDGVDNDGNGKIDCEDPACIAGGGCVEDCDNGLDDDFDDAVDCDDSDCDASTACMEPFLAADMACGEGGWKYSEGANNVAWAIDATPAAVKPYTGECTLNYNNGKNYCGVASCNGLYSWSAGTATMEAPIDATGYSKLIVSYWSYLATSGSNNDDLGWLQLSTDNFKGCCGPTNQCSNESPNNCNTDGTQSFQVPKDQLNAWRAIELDGSKFAGKSFQLRFRFNSVTAWNNSTAGWFVDDLRLYGVE